MNSEAIREPVMLNINDGHFQVTNGLAYPLRTLEWNGDAILDACTVRADYGHLIVLTRDGALHGIDLDTGASVRLCRVLTFRLAATTDISVQPDIACTHRQTVCMRPLSSTKDRVASSSEHGLARYRCVSHGGDYCDETVPFSACFLRLEGHDVFVHRTAWNRLDAADPATGVSLTSRDIAPYEAGGERPTHYLDYFHGQLRPSPDGSLIFDDGWVWHPISVPRVWSVTNWLESNPWESEDGASIVDLAMRDDWTKPTCWINKRHLALWGLAGWDEDELEGVSHGPGVHIIDVTERKPLPDVWPMDSQSERVLDLFSDGARLYVVDDIGTTAWDLASRAMLARFPSFTARLLDQARNTFVAYSDLAIHELQLPWPGENHGRR